MTETSIKKRSDAPKVAPLYVHRKVTNAADIHAWGKAQGFTKMVPPEEMHATILHSSKALDWTKAGDHFDNLKAEGGDRRVKPLGGKGAIVFYFDSGELSDRHDQFIAAGGSNDFDGYQPHITLTYAGGDLDTASMQPYDGPISFGPEVYEDLNDNWVDSIVEKRGKYIKIEKVNDELGLVFGWAIICTINGQPYFDLNIDPDGERVPEHIPEDAMLRACTSFAAGARPGNEMHDGPDKGTYYFLMPMTAEIAAAFGITTSKTGLMVGYKPPKSIFDKFKSGEFTGFSIEGSRLKSEENPA